MFADQSPILFPPIPVLVKERPILLTNDCPLGKPHPDEATHSHRQIMDYVLDDIHHLCPTRLENHLADAHALQNSFPHFKLNRY